MHATTFISFSSLIFSFILIFKSFKIQRQNRFVKIPVRIEKEYPQDSYRR